MATAVFSKFAGILSAALSQHHLLGFENSSAGVPSPALALFIVKHMRKLKIGKDNQQRPSLSRDAGVKITPVAHGRLSRRSCRQVNPSTQDKTPQAVQANLVTAAPDFPVSAMGVWQRVSALTRVHLLHLKVVNSFLCKPITHPPYRNVILSSEDGAKP